MQEVHRQAINRVAALALWARIFGIAPTFLDISSLCDALEGVLPSLSDRERRVLELRCGLVDGRERTLKEVGEHEDIGLTRERVRQIEAKALRKLRHPSRSQLLWCATMAGLFRQLRRDLEDEFRGLREAVSSWRHEIEREASEKLAKRMKELHDVGNVAVIPIQGLDLPIWLKARLVRAGMQYAVDLVRLLDGGIRVRNIGAKTLAMVERALRDVGVIPKFVDKGEQHDEDWD